MHPKLLTSRLIQHDGKPETMSTKIHHLVGGGSTTSDDIRRVAAYAESLMTSARPVDHVPLNFGLSQIVSLELGSDDKPAQGKGASSTKSSSINLPLPKQQSAAPTMYANVNVAPPEPRQETPSAIVQRQLEGFRVQQQQQQHASIQIHQIRQLQQAMQAQFLLQQGGATAYLQALALQQQVLQQQQQQLQQAPQTRPVEVVVTVDKLPNSKPKRPRAIAPHPRDAEEDKGDNTNTAHKRAKMLSEKEAGEDDDDSVGGHRFRPYQYEQWTEKFQELCDFRKAKSHCQVPHTYTDNPPLARWVKRQRYQYKLKVESKQSTMTDERIKLLEDIGFIWDSHAAAWAEKLQELKEYAQLKGDCNVPSTYPENPQLATWVKCQRRQYKLLRDSKTSNMTMERIVDLEKVGFIWEVRKSWDSRQKAASA